MCLVLGGVDLGRVGDRKGNVKLSQRPHRGKYIPGRL